MVLPGFGSVRGWLLLALLMTLPVASARGDLAADLGAFARVESEAVAAIGGRVRLNETAGRDEWLLAWLVGENHLSLGIGHFIWYPAGRGGRFRESFIDFLRFLQARGGPVPVWLTPATACPWADRRAFLAAGNDPRLAELRALIAGSIEAQSAFLIERLARSLPALLKAVPAAERPQLEGRLAALLRPRGGVDADGVYALVDYVNFKGEGLAAGERHQGVGWGLLQVLQGMADSATAGGEKPLAAFARSAARVLERRVALSPPERREGRWLRNWLARVATYAPED